MVEVLLLDAYPLSFASIAIGRSEAMVGLLI
jgi:hypothetical protein